MIVVLNTVVIVVFEFFTLIRVLRSTATRISGCKKTKQILIDFGAEHLKGFETIIYF